MTSGHAVAFVAVGSNLEPEKNIPAAERLLAKRVRVLARSAFYRNSALGRPEQPDFVNGAWMIETDLPPRALKFDVLRIIEAELGRVRTADKFAPRTIDLDLVLYDNQEVDDPDLRLPDPEMGARLFLAAPLLDLGADADYPALAFARDAVRDAIRRGELTPVEISP